MLPIPKDAFRLQIPCGMCAGRGWYENHETCKNCQGDGWQVGDLTRLTGAQLQQLRILLPAVPLDPELPFPESDPMDNLGKLLQRRTIHTVSFPGPDATRIDLISKDGSTLRLYMEKTNGQFTHLNALPLPPGP